MTTAYLNGRFQPLEETVVPVMDRGFLFGDGVYEVIPVYGKKLFRLEHHLKRLQNSLDAVRISNPLDNDGWEQVLTRLVESGTGEDQSVYLQVTRGVAPKRDHAFPENIQPTVFAMSAPVSATAKSLDDPGVHAVTLEDIRWKRCNIKAITLLPNVLMKQQALEAGGGEAILIDNGHAMEGAASNLFVVRDGELLTPPKGNGLLPGITRDLVLELAAANAVPFRETHIGEAELYSADEVWLTSSTREISPVVRVNDSVIADGKPGPLWKKMIQLYQAYKDAVRRGDAA